MGGAEKWSSVQIRTLKFLNVRICTEDFFFLEDGTIFFFFFFFFFSCTESVHYFPFLYTQKYSAPIVILVTNNNVVIIFLAQSTHYRYRISEELIWCKMKINACSILVIRDWIQSSGLPFVKEKKQKIGVEKPECWLIKDTLSVRVH